MRSRLTRLLRQHAYRRLWVARTVSQWGDAVNTVALRGRVFAGFDMLWQTGRLLSLLLGGLLADLLDIRAVYYLGGALLLAAALAGSAGLRATGTAPPLPSSR